MQEKKKKPVDITKIKPEDALKYEIAKEIGLYEKVIQEGWAALSAKESGRIGGIMTRKRLQEKRAVDRET